jgi:hypothetical protein
MAAQNEAQLSEAGRLALEQHNLGWTRKKLA